MSWRKGASFALVGAAFAIACFLAFPAWPDDWDGLGFLASVRHFDLAAFAPHPPGYPVYVALLKMAAMVTSSPLGAARLVAVVSGLVTFGSIGFGLIDAPLAAAAICACPLVFRAFTSVGSEAPALAFAAVALAGLTTRRPWLVGLAVGLGLGVRLSWAPFYLPLLVLLPVRLRLRACALALLACVAWAVPLVLLTGPAKLLALGHTHLVGHMEHWGGTALTDPTRLRFLARDLFVDGLGGATDPLGIAILVALACLITTTLSWRFRGVEQEERKGGSGESLGLDPLKCLPFFRPSCSILSAFLLMAPYLAWVTFGQNLRAQPRHVLPIVFFALLLLARAALDARASRFARVAFGVLPLLFVTRSALDALDRRNVPPPGAQLLAYVGSHATVATSALFTGASGRFLDSTPWQSRTHAAGSLSDALLALTHFDSVPSRMFVTSELTGLDESPTPLSLVATFCRPERIDRRMPCMQLYELDPKAALTR